MVKNPKAKSKPDAHVEGAETERQEPEIVGAGVVQHLDLSDAKIKVKCTRHEVHLGDGRVLLEGEEGMVSKQVADALAKYDNVDVVK